MPKQIQKIQGAYLPHWRAKNGIYFVTFRLAGSLPSCLAKDREDRRREIFSRVEESGRDFTSFELDELEELHFEELDHRRHDLGADHMKNPLIAKVVADAFMHFEGIRYQLFAWVIMSNHVHIVFQPIHNHDVPDILHSWKRFSAREANKILGRTGSFWWPEYYDHLIRNDADLERCIEYTWNNPEKAGLRNYKWKWRAPTPPSRVKNP